MHDFYDDLPIVDAHHHLWDLEGSLAYPWLANDEHSYMGDNSALRRSYLPPEYRRDTALHNVVATVHVEAECDRRRQVAETRVADPHRGPPRHAQRDRRPCLDRHARRRGHPRPAQAVPAGARHPDEADHLDGTDRSVRGQPRSMQDPRWRNGLSLLEKHDLSWDLRVTWWHLEEAAEVVREHPGLRIVLNHTGYPLDRSPEALAVWRRGMEALAACPTCTARSPA